MELRSGKTLGSCAKRRRTRTSSSHNWSYIQADILFLIAGKIVSIGDFVRFCAVCRPWYLLATDFYVNDKLNIGPLYMPATDPNSNLITLRNPASDATLVLDSPAAAGTHFWGSPFGWLITYTDLSFTLVNPFTGATIPLPPLPKSRSWYARHCLMKLVLTANPESDPGNCLVFLSLDMPMVAFARPGAKVWSHIKNRVGLDDLVHYKGKLYGIENKNGREVKLFLFELDHREGGKLHPRAVPILTLHLISDEETQHPQSHKNLVDFDGDLCLCLLYYRQYYFPTNFKVFKINLSTGDLTQVSSFGDHCLFLGNNYSFSYKTTYPHSTFFEQALHVPRELVSNCVFYTHSRPPFHVEVWDMQRSVNVYSSGTLLTNTNPVWILPSISFRKLEDAL